MVNEFVRDYMGLQNEGMPPGALRADMFLLNSYQESNNVDEEDTKLDIYLMNGKKFQVNIRNTDPTDHVIQVTWWTCTLSSFNTPPPPPTPC